MIIDLAAKVTKTILTVFHMFIKLDGDMEKKYIYINPKQ